MENLEYYVLNYDWNRKKLYNFNIFDSIRFSEFLEKDFEDYKENGRNYETFKEEVRKDLMSAFWSKREYELFIGDAFDTNIDNYEKVDVYSQVLPNLDILVKYIIDNLDTESSVEKN